MEKLSDYLTFQVFLVCYLKKINSKLIKRFINVKLLAMIFFD